MVPGSHVLSESCIVSETSLTLPPDEAVLAVLTDAVGTFAILARPRAHAKPLPSIAQRVCRRQLEREENQKTLSPGLLRSNSRKNLLTRENVT